MSLHDLATVSVYLGAIVTFMLAAFWRPQLGVYFLAFVIPLQTMRARIETYPMGEKLIDFIVLGVVIGLLLRRNGAGWVWTPMTRIIIFWSLFLYVSLFFGSFFLQAPWPISIYDIRVSEWKNYIELPFLLLVTASAIRDRRQMKICLAIMAFTFLMVNRGFYSSMSDRDLTQFASDKRDAGPIGYAGVNGLAAFEATCMLFMVGMLGFKISRYAKWALYGLLATGVYCLLYSFSRGGYLGLMVGLIYLGIVRQRKLLVLAAVLIIGWQTLLPLSVQQRITMTYEADDVPGELDSSSQQRVDLWKNAQTIIEENPIFGTGFDTYFYMAKANYAKLRDTHNYYVKMMLETGAIGLLFFFFVLWRMFALGLRLYRRSDDPFLSAVGLSFTALLVGMLAVNIFGDRWSFLQVDAYMWMTLGLVIRGLMITQQEASENLALASPALAMIPERPARELVPSFGIAKGPGLVSTR